MLPGEPARSPHRRLGAIALLSILLLSPFAPHAAAQIPDRNVVVVVFDKSPPVYNESEPVVMSITTAPGTPRAVDSIRVFCEMGCPPAESRVYSAPSQSDLAFPHHFCQFINNARDCTNVPTPAELREPGWNGTWAVSLRDGFGVEIYRTHFRVELTDAWKHNYSMEATETLWVRAGGFLPNTFVKISFGHVESSGREVLFRNLTMPVSNSGRALGWWNIPKEEAYNARCDRCHRYFVEVRADPASGNTKTYERTEFFVTPAVVKNRLLSAPSVLTRVEFERTEWVPYQFHLSYPDFSGVGAVDFGELQPEVKVQRVDPNTGVPGLVLVLKPEYLSGGIWLANWTIPRDLPLKTPAGKAYEFRMVFDARTDRYGNYVLANASDPFTVNPATLKADFLDPPEKVERSDLVSWIVVPRYHDGELFDNKVNGTWLSGSFVRIQDQNEMPVPDSTVRARWIGGGWEFRYEFGRGYEPLGAHAFRFHGEFAANDTWGNYIESNRTVFLLGKALPRVQLTEKAGKDLLNVTTGWTRGQRVDLTAKITYGNGSAYNAARNIEGSIINATLTKRRGPTEIVEVAIVPFRLINEANGLWTASLALSLTDRETPLGNWTLSLPLEDQEKNGGSREFHRVVRATTLRVEPQNFPKHAYQLGEKVSWTFSLAYPDGKPATDQDLSVLAVDVYRWSGEKVLGLEQAGLAAEWRPEKNWRVTWTPRSGLVLGEFVFIPRGGDRFGNPLGPGRSDAVRIFVPTVNREVMLHPPPVVARNETVYVMFDALPGDTGEDETGCPRIAVERWSNERWVIEVEDVLLGRCEAGRDHFSSWTTSPSSTLGTYRFRFSGRDSARAYLNATSAAFNLVPLNASRPALAQPGEVVAKGEPVEFRVRPDRTDQFLGVWVLQFGQRLVKAELIHGNLTSWVVRWTPEYRITSGEYQFEVLGRDKDGNALRVVSRPFEVGDVEVGCEVLEPVPAASPRGDKIRFTFRCLLPDGTVAGRSRGTPEVTLHNATGARMAAVPVTNLPPNWEVGYEVPLSLPVGVYHFRISGRDDAGNSYAELATGNFTLTPGAIQRSWEAQPKSITRLETMAASARANRTDQPTLTCYGAYLGTYVPPQKAGEVEPVGTVEVIWTPNPTKGTHDLSWAVPIDASLGWYRLDCAGRDATGNTVTWVSLPFQVLPARLAGSRAKDGAPPQEAFVAGATLVFRATVGYGADRSILTADRAARVDAFFTLEGRPVEQRPVVDWDPVKREWVMTWEAPAVLPPGTYVLYITGADRYGNPLPTNRIVDYKVAPELGERLFGIPGFDRAVPSISPLAAAVAAVAVAAILLRRRRED